MINLIVTVSNISTVINIFDRVQIMRYNSVGEPTIPIVESEFVTISGGIDDSSGINNVSYITLVNGTSQYTYIDPEGDSDDKYISRYANSINGALSEWSVPVTGETGELYINPLYPKEVYYTDSEQLVIDRIRVLIGDPINVRREYGDDTSSSIHQDGKTYELDEKGWPISIYMGDSVMNSMTNPTVNGYKYLVFDDYISEVCHECTTYSGVCGEDVVKDVVRGPDIWYYTFRNSDREIINVYDNCPPPSPLTSTTATTDAYMLQTAIDILRRELWEDATEDGAEIADNSTKYNPDPGLKIRKLLLKDLQDKLDKLIKSTILSGISGVLID